MLAAAGACGLVAGPSLVMAPLQAMASWLGRFEQGSNLSNRMNMKRMRGRTHRSGGGGGSGGGSPRQYGGNIPLNRNHVFDSSGPDLRIRGTAQQLFEKYLQLGRDATGAGDRVMAESYFQYAEHYFRILNAINQAAQQGAGPNGQPHGAPNGQYQGQAPLYNGQQRREREYGDPAEPPQAGAAQAPGFGEQPALEAEAPPAPDRPRPRTRRPEDPGLERDPVAAEENAR